MFLSHQGFSQEPDDCSKHVEVEWAKQGKKRLKRSGQEIKLRVVRDCLTEGCIVKKGKIITGAVSFAPSRMFIKTSIRFGNEFIYFVAYDKSDREIGVISRWQERTLTVGEIVNDQLDTNVGREKGSKPHILGKGEDVYLLKPDEGQHELLQSTQCKSPISYSTHGAASFNENTPENNRPKEDVHIERNREKSRASEAKKENHLYAQSKKQLSPLNGSPTLSKYSLQKNAEESKSYASIFSLKASSLIYSIINKSCSQDSNQKMSESTNGGSSSEIQRFSWWREIFLPVIVETASKLFDVRLILKLLKKYWLDIILIISPYIVIYRVTLSRRVMDYLKEKVKILTKRGVNIFMLFTCSFVIMIFFTKVVQENLQSPRYFSKFSPSDKNLNYLDFESIIEYGGPSKRNRVIFGNSDETECQEKAKGTSDCPLIPYGKPWRLGANKVTTIKFNKKVKFGDKNLDPGTYGLYTKPGENYWDLCISKKNRGSGKKMEELVDGKVFCTKVPVYETECVEEKLKIYFKELNQDLYLFFNWDKVETKVKIIPNQSILVQH